MKKTLISQFVKGATATTVALSAVGLVQAQEERGESGVESIEEVIITGIRGSALSTRAAKRNNSNVSDGIFATDIGKLPDSNIAEAMQRITGVGIDRVDGEGTGITIRGIESSQNNITLNGAIVTSGEDNNNVDLNAFSADLLKSIEVIKSRSAKHDEGSLGGQVVLETFRPLEVADRVASLSADVKRNDLGSTTDYDVNATFSDQLVDDVVGVTANLFYDVRTSRTDSQQNFNWRLFNAAQAFNAADTSQVVGSVFDPVGFESQVRIKERTRFGGTSTFQFAPDDVSTVTLDLSYTNLKNDLIQDQQRITGARANNGDDNGDPNSFLNLVDPNTGSSAYFEGEASGTNLSRRQIDVTETFVGGLNYERQIGDWNVQLAATRSASKQDWIVNRRVNFRASAERLAIDWVGYRDSQEFQDAQANGALPASVDTSSYSVIPTITFLEGVNQDAANPGELLGNFNPNTNNLVQLFEDDRLLRDDASTFSFDIQRDVDFGIISSVEAGAKYTKRVKDNTSVSGVTGGPVDDEGASILAINTVLNEGTPEARSVSFDFPYNDYLDGVVSNASQGWRVPDVEFVFDTFRGDFEGTLNPIASNEISQVFTAAYAQANISTLEDRLTGDVGVRIVETRSTAVGNQGFNFRDNVSFAQPASINNIYRNVLPSLNLRLETGENSQVRLGVAREIARPRQSELRPGTIFNFTNEANLRANGTNPQLDPTVSTQYDVSWEWYPGEAGSVTAGIFYKDIGSFNFNQVSIDTITCPIDIVNNPEAAEICFELQGRDVTVTQTENGQGGFVGGVELGITQDFSFLPGFLGNTGAILNYTFADGEATLVDPTNENSEAYEGFPFPATSKHTANSTLYWENDSLSVRFAYTYRSPSLQNATNLVGSIWNDQRRQLDMSANLDISDNLSVSFKANNLTNESDRTFQSLTLGDEGRGNGFVDFLGEGNVLDNNGPRNRTNRSSNSGRDFSLGLRYEF